MKQQLFTPNASAVSDTSIAMVEEKSMEILPPNAVEAMTRAEIDIQISTAHRFPRTLAGFKKRAVDMVTIDEETALSCIYSRPVGMKNGKQTYAEGLSVRMAEIIGAAYGNLRVGATLIEQTERFVRARGYAHDLEANFAATSEVIESTVKRDGTPYDERMRVVIAKACLAKALRDATFKVVPRALCKPVENEAKRIAIGDAKTLETRRKAVFEWVAKINVAPERVFTALGVEGEEDIGADELKTLLGLHTAIKDGEVTIDEAFPRVVAKAATPKRLKKEEPSDDGATVIVPDQQ